jgi:diaminopimelate decarboxylase
MTHKKTPFDKTRLEEIIEEYPTPFHIYDEAAIRKNAQEFYKAFSWTPGGFKNFFAVKALPNPHILKIVFEEGMGFDCSSLPELILAAVVGAGPDDLMFSSNDTPAAEYIRSKEMGAIINLDDISHISFLEEHAGIPKQICFRYNPGNMKEGNSIIGNPEDAKYGLTREQMLKAYGIAKKKGAEQFGIHAMVASNELDPEYFIETASILFDLIAEISETHDINIDFVNLGGGIGIPYTLEQVPVDLTRVSEGIHSLYRSKIEDKGIGPVRIVTENGRMVTGPFGYLVSRVLHMKDTYKKYVGLDANMANLMRPAIYGAYHHITVMGKEETPREQIYDVTGSLCENNDKFAIDRKLPPIEIGDLVAIHDTGAHGHAMGFNYNGKLRSAELLLKTDGSVVQIRRAETPADYFGTLDFPGLS